jgi:hypothetical protein
MVLPPDIHRWDLDWSVTLGLVTKNRDDAGNLKTLESESRRVAAEILDDGKIKQKSWQEDRINVYLSVAGVAELAISRLSLLQTGSIRDRWQIQQWTGEFDDEIVSALPARKTRDITRELV